MSDVVISKKERSVFHELYCPYVNRIKKPNRKQISEDEAVKRGYCECKFCRSVRGIVYKYKENADAEVTYDPIDDAMCVKTKVGFWKLIWRENIQAWHLFHQNHKGYKCFNSELPSKVLMRGSFHRQEDFKPTSNAGKAIRYILDHDRNYSFAETDIRKMPQRTPTQRKHYRQQKKRKKREEIKNVFRIFKDLERKENK